MTKSEYQKEWRRNNAERLRKYHAVYRQTHKEELRKKDAEYYQKNKEHLNQLNTQWAKDHPEERKKQRSKSDRNNQAKRTELQRRRTMKLKQATPAWVDLDKIREVYEACPQGMTVDHIIPLHGKNVCGLHVVWNLQYLSRSDNARKGNRV